MKRCILFLLSLYMSAVAIAQTLVAEGSAPNLYISHTVAPKENFYSVGRLFNQSPKAIVAFNNLTIEKGLTIGQHIKIPLTEQNFATGNQGGEGEKLIPLSHKVAAGENIFKIANSHNVTAQSIREWNLLSSDKVAAGTMLIIGYLKVKSAESSLASATNAITPAIKEAKPDKTQEVRTIIHEPAKDVPVEVANPNAIKKSEGGFSTIEVNKSNTSEPAKSPVKTGGIKPEIKNAPVVTPTPKTDPTKENTTTEQPAKATPPAPVKNERKNIDLSNTSASVAEGAFASVYSSDILHKSLSITSGDAATFKSTSGWQDKKYYVLINNVTPGTIMKITTANGKVVYAKVLGSMPEMKENNGLLLRISNAAASYLGMTDPKFQVDISYYQ